MIDVGGSSESEDKSGCQSPHVCLLPLLVKAEEEAAGGDDEGNEDVKFTLPINLNNPRVRPRGLKEKSGEESEAGRGAT